MTADSTLATRPESGGTGRDSVRIIRIFLPILVPAVLIAAWWFSTVNSTSPYFPPLATILDRFLELWVVGDAKEELVPSLRNLGAGFLIGSVAGVALGMLMWRITIVRQAVSPIVYFLYVLPAPALLPAMIAIFGIGDMRQVALIAFGSIWPALFNTLDGMRGVDSVKHDAAAAMGVGRNRTTLSVDLPGASPQIAAGLRASLQVSLILMVISEMVAATHGIGFFILYSQTTFAIVNMWTGIMMLAIVGVVLNFAFIGIERRILQWHYRSRRIGGEA